MYQAIMAKILEILETELKEIERRHKLEIDEIQSRHKMERLEIDTALQAVRGISHAKFKMKRNMNINDAFIEAVENGRRKPITILEFIKTHLGIETTIASIRVRGSKLFGSGLVGRDADGYIPISINKVSNEKSPETSNFTGESPPNKSTALSSKDDALNLEIPEMLRRT